MKMLGICRNSENKMKFKKGLWSPEEDQRLKNHILKHGHGCWTEVPIKAGLERNGKSCRLRWINYLRPGIKRGRFSQEEEDLAMKLHTMLGNKWSQIAMHLPGRTDNEVKNYWNTYLKKRVKQSENPHSSPKFAENDPSADSSAEINKNKQTNLGKVSIFDSFESLESSSHGKEKMQNSWPKVMFADWIFGENSDCLQSSERQDSFSFENKERFGNGDLRGGMSCEEIGVCGGSYSSYFESVDLVGGDSFDFLSFGGFEMNEDLMF